MSELTPIKTLNGHALVDTAARDDIGTLQKDKLAASELQSAINSALAQAKESGEFKGETPVRGEDYWTQADQKQIVSDVLAALPSGEAPHQMLVTGVDGNAVWEDRLCYTEMMQREVVPETELIYIEDAGMFAIVNQPTNQPAVGVNHTVIYNGTAYECTAMNTEGGVALGNTAVIETGEYDPMGAPFVIVFTTPEEVAAQGAWGALMALDGATSVTVSVRINGEYVKTIDKKYIPAMLEHFIVTVVSKDQMYVADRTYEELLAAYDAGKMLYCRYAMHANAATRREEVWFPLSMYNEQSCSFTFVAPTHRNIGAGAGSVSGFTIFDDGKCALVEDKSMSLDGLHMLSNGGLVLRGADGRDYRMIVSADGTLSAEKIYYGDDV